MAEPLYAPVRAEQVHPGFFPRLRLKAERPLARQAECVGERARGWQRFQRMARRRQAFAPGSADCAHCARPSQSRGQQLPDLPEEWSAWRGDWPLRVPAALQWAPPEEIPMGVTGFGLPAAAAERSP